MANNKDKPAEESAAAEQGPGKKPAASTPEGAPTDEAHRDAGDGTLQGSVPAGLTAEQLRKRAKAASATMAGPAEVAAALGHPCVARDHGHATW